MSKSISSFCTSAHFFPPVLVSLFYLNWTMITSLSASCVRFPFDVTIHSPVDFTTGEWGVQKEADLDVLDWLLAFARVAVDLLSKQLGQQHQVVVLDPDQIAIADNLRDGLGEESVGLLVCAPVLLVERDLTRVVVEQWPENAICVLHHYDSERIRVCEGEAQSNELDRLIFSCCYLLENPL